MKMGTKSLLFGAHQFLIHPLFVALAWWKLYGFPKDWRLWVAFYLHDIGYFGCEKMDDEKGEEHPITGAALVSAICDRGADPNCPCCRGTIIHSNADEEWKCEDCYQREYHWLKFTLYHSRFLAKRNGAQFSKLCVADKYAFCLTPAWLYVPMTMATGEIWEYMGTCSSSVYNPWQWHSDLKAYLKAWVYRHLEADKPEDVNTTRKFHATT